MAKRQRAAPKKHERPTGDPEVIGGRSAEEIQEAEGDSMSKILDQVMKTLKRAWKRANPAGEPGKDYVDYYRFVLHPHDFAQSVENMFYVSFLARDKRLRIHVDRTTGLPSLEKLTKEQLDNLGESVQVVTTITPDIWRVG